MRRSIVFLLIILIVGACKKDDLTTGFLEGVVTDKATGDNLEDVRIIVFDANTNSPTGNSHTTNNVGEYNIELGAGTYFLKLYKLGYNSIPNAGSAPIPITVSLGEETVTNFMMSESEITNGSIISGKVESAGSALPGVLVVAENNQTAISSVSDGEGNYYIYNVIPGDYEIRGWLSGYNSSSQSVSVTANSELQDINLELTNDANASVSGVITFLATENVEVDVSLVHPKTKETIPGLSSITEGGNYLFSNVPDGTYLGRASYANDNNVMDPDWIVKNGEPYLTVDGTDEVLNFSITNAVSLLSPTNDSTSVFPIEIPIDSAVFKWEAYPSTSEYVIEVSDASGNVIWGGFSEDWSIKNIVIPSSQLEINFDADNTASQELVSGNIYRWKIYASKDDNQSTSGFRLISASEDQMGLFKIID